MRRVVDPTEILAEAAAMARIHQMQSRYGEGAMSTRQRAGDSAVIGDVAVKQPVRAMWQLGDYHRFAKSTIWEIGPELVAACEIGPGQRVLDVATGSGNTALRAAQAGASVVASDVTPESFQAGRREAEALGVTLDWQEGDAQALPFDDGEFDVVTSSFGVIFANDQEAAAAEMLRVCRPGGTIGLTSFRPEGVGAQFFELVGRYAPAPPPGSRSPLYWGTEDNLRALFGDGITELRATPRTYVERAASPRAYHDLFMETFGPVIAIRSFLPPERRADFERDFMAFAENANRGTAGGPAEYPYDYLLVVARKRSH
jgi:ubiquinone/menaquinone biosynthesis C-methylase UbiE